MYKKAPKFKNEKDAKKFAKEHPETFCVFECWDEFDEYGYRGTQGQYVFFETLYDMNMHLEQFPKRLFGSCVLNPTARQYSFKKGGAK